MKGKLIYIVDDDENIRNNIKLFLCHEGYNVESFADGGSFINKFKVKPADLIVLDVMIPDIDGFTLCSNIRNNSSVPIIFISGKDDEKDIVNGFNIGCDGYLIKPFSILELVARVKGLFRRIELDNLIDSNSEQRKIADLVINYEELRATCRGEELKLTKLEFSLLCYLCDNIHRVVNREELLQEVWGYKYTVKTRTIDSTIKRIRKKLLEVGTEIEIYTKWGAGFILGVKHD